MRLAALARVGHCSSASLFRLLFIAVSFYGQQLGSTGGDDLMINRANRPPATATAAGEMLQRNSSSVVMSMAPARLRATGQKRA